jgi:hypothetical protein
LPLLLYGEFHFWDAVKIDDDSISVKQNEEEFFFLKNLMEAAEAP